MNPAVKRGKLNKCPIYEHNNSLREYLCIDPNCDKNP